MSATREIKRYVNRKLYDPVKSRYITMSEIVPLYRSLGPALRVRCMKTNDDITKKTLLTAIFENSLDGNFFLQDAIIKLAI